MGRNTYKAVLIGRSSMLPIDEARSDLNALRDLFQVRDFLTQRYNLSPRHEKRDGPVSQRGEIPEPPGEVPCT